MLKQIDHFEFRKKIYIFALLSINNLNSIIKMSTIKINQPGKPAKWVKEINKLDGTVTFTTDKNEAYVRDGSFYCKSEIKTLKNPIMYDQEKYPELQFAVLDY